MIWVTWRLHRNQATFAVAAMVGLAAILVPTGIHFAHVYNQAVAGCGSASGCGDLSDVLFQGDRWLFNLVPVLVMVVPALFGVFWGAPVFAKEIEDGTHKLAWTQSVTRRHWAATNIVWVLLGAAVWGGAMSALVTWWSGPENALRLDRFNPGWFDTQGIVPAAYAVFAVALGMAAGAVLRRVLPAIAVTLGGYVGVRVFFQVLVRSHYMAPVIQSFPIGKGPGPAGGAWVLSNDLVSAAGQVMGTPHAIQATAGPAGKAIPVLCGGVGQVKITPDCLAAQGYHLAATFQPASRYWSFQGIESAIFVAMAALLVAFAVWRILRTDA